MEECVYKGNATGQKQIWALKPRTKAIPAAVPHSAGRLWARHVTSQDSDLSPLPAGGRHTCSAHLRGRENKGDNMLETISVIQILLIRAYRALNS